MLTYYTLLFELIVDGAHQTGAEGGVRLIEGVCVMADGRWRNGGRRRVGTESS